MTRKRVNIISAAAALLFMLPVCGLFPLYSDDWHFKFVFYDFDPIGSDKRVESFGDILLSLRNYYAVSGGRVLAHFLLYIVDRFDKWVFNILNSAIFALFGYFVYRLAGGASLPKYFLPAVYVLLMIAVPDFGGSTVWMSGAVNYLWMGTLALGFLLLLGSYCEKPGRSKYAALCLTALLTGATNEITGGMMIVLIIVYLFLSRKKPAPRLMLPALLLIAGELVIILAPGNSVRAAEIDETEIFSLSVILEIIPGTLSWYCEKYFFITAVIIIANIFLFDKSRENAASIAFFISGIAGTAALSLSGTFIPRAHFLPVVFILISFTISVSRIFQYIYIYIYICGRNSQKFPGSCSGQPSAWRLCLPCSGCC